MPASWEADGFYLGLEASEALSLSSPSGIVEIGMAPLRRTMNSLAPKILLDEENVIVVTDASRTLFEMTSGTRKNIGPVFLVDWNALSTRGEKIASWNPLGRDWLGESRRQARLTIESLIMLISRHAGLGESERLLLEDVACVLTEMPDYFEASPSGKIDGIPLHWCYLDASLPLLHDALPFIVARLSSFEAVTRRMAAAERERGRSAKWLMARAGRFSALLKIDPARLMAMSVKALRALSFSVSSPAMRERLSSNSFSWRHLRGHPSAERIRMEASRLEEKGGLSVQFPAYGKRDLKPMTIYLSHGGGNIAAQTIATDLFLQTVLSIGAMFRPGVSGVRGVTMGPHGLSLIIDMDLCATLRTDFRDAWKPASPPSLGVSIHTSDIASVLERNFAGMDLHALARISSAVLLDFETRAGIEAARILFPDFDERYPAGLDRTARLVFFGEKEAEEAGIVRPVFLETRPVWIMEDCSSRVRMEGVGPAPASGVALRDLETPPTI